MNTQNSTSSKQHPFPHGKLVVLKYDMEFRISYANEACAEMLGARREALIGSSIKDVAHPDVPPELIADIRCTTTSGRPWQGMAKLKHSDGGYVWSSALTIPIRKDGANVGFMSLRSEATPERVLEEEQLYDEMRRGKHNYKSLDMPVRKSLSNASMLLLLGGVACVTAMTLLFVALAEGIASTVGAFLLLTSALGLSSTLFLIARLWRRSVSEPSVMLKAFERIAEGDLTNALPVGRSDESGRLMESLMYMQGRLKVMLDEIRLAASMTDTGNSVLRSEVLSMQSAAQSQRDRIHSVSAATEQNCVAVGEVASSAKAAADSSRTSLSLVAEGSTLLSQTMDAADQTVEAVDGTKQAMSSLANSIQTVASISAEIREISDQTNLLALNAAIEAARAGELGRGFAVVADEVRKLAERTAHCTGKIGHMVTDIDLVSTQVSADMARTAHQVCAVSDKLKESLKIIANIERGSQQASDLATHIADASAEQSSASEQIAQDMEAISGLVERSTTGITAVDQATKGMQATVENLKQLIGNFRVTA